MEKHSFNQFFLMHWTNWTYMVYMKQNNTFHQLIFLTFNLIGKGYFYTLASRNNLFEEQK